MSVQAITSALAMTGVSSNEKYLLIVLANYADAEFRCWPSIKRLCDDTGMSERTVQRCFKALVEAGIIRRSERKRQDGSRTSDLLTLVFDGGARLAPRGANRDTGGRQSDASAPSDWRPGGVTVAPLTTFEPTIEPSTEPSLKCARDFERFWRAYPEKKGKRAAELAFAKALKRGTIDQMLWAIEDAKSHSKKWLEGYIPNPATWLNQDRWKDEHSDRPTASPQLIRRHENYGRALSGFATSADPRDDHG